MDHAENTRRISAQQVTIEVTDEASGQIYRRTLPIDYLETANVLRLAAEDSSGKPAELVFFSSAGLDHLKDMTGAGPDQDRCGTHA